MPKDTTSPGVLASLRMSASVTSLAWAAPMDINDAAMRPSARFRLLLPFITFLLGFYLVLSRRRPRGRTAERGRGLLQGTCHSAPGALDEPVLRQGMY